MEQVRIKKVINKNGKIQYYLGDGLYYNRISNLNAESGLSTNKYTLFEQIKTIKGIKFYWSKTLKKYVTIPED